MVSRERKGSRVAGEAEEDMNNERLKERERQLEQKDPKKWRMSIKK